MVEEIYSILVKQKLYVMSIHEFIDFLKPLDYLPYKWKYRNVCHFSSHVKLKNSILEGFNGLGKNTYIRDCKIGFGSHINSSTRLSKTQIGRFCSIGQHVEVILGIHPTKENISTCPLFYKNTKSFYGTTIITTSAFDDSPPNVDNEDYAVVIENDVWIGSHVLIMPGVTIHNGAVIGAGSIVTKDIPPYTICVGAPAKVIKKRFSDAEIDILQKMKWWENKDYDILRKYASIFNNPIQFFKYCTEPSFINGDDRMVR